ncbi:hypothetical protein [Streptomyces cyaneochromogenes]|uniref:hypothetical protein n=1 Tax=Streptomyces cyaneochromogenes TaxID=2496836 RepID=UPI001E63A5D5|nr:hypothetical protein [Streptomyces cyaneochromogenes]
MASATSLHLTPAPTVTVVLSGPRGPMSARVAVSMTSPPWICAWPLVACPWPRWCDRQAVGVAVPDHGYDVTDRARAQYGDGTAVHDVAEVVAGGRE